MNHLYCQIWQRILLNDFDGDQKAGHALAHFLLQRQRGLAGVFIFLYEKSYGSAPRWNKAFLSTVHRLRPLISDLPMPVAGWTAVLFAALFLAIVEGVQAGAG